MILKRNEATTRRGLGSWKVRAIASFECATEMPVESTSKRRCARRSTPTVSSPSPEGRGGQGVRPSLLANAPAPSLRSRYEYATHDGRGAAVHQRAEQADGAGARPARRA